MKRVKWPMKRRFWRRVNGITARLAWKYARPPGPDRGIALRIDHSHPLWRLNSWVGDQWINWWIEQVRRER